MTDWRLQGQEGYLQGATLRRAAYRPYREGWDHDHCEFCFSKLAVQGGDATEGYVTDDGYRWICEGCFADFKERFAWKLANGG